MLGSRALFITLLAFASSLGANAQFCGGAGYDVSSTMRDLSLVSGEYTFWVHPCGNVASTSDPQCAIPAEAPYGAMYCQRGAALEQTWVLSNWNATVAANQALWYASENGVTLEVANGDVCGAVGNYFRTTIIEFRCDASATTPVFVSASEPETCSYKAVINTASACRANGATAGNAVGSSFYSMECGAGRWDFSQLRNQDLHYDGEGFDYWMRMCAYVTNSTCDRVQPSSFCQKFDSDTAVPVDISDWNFTTPQLYTITPRGVDVTMREGDACGGQPRRATYSLQCNPRATRRPWISYVSEYQTCHYKAIIQTAAVCNGQNGPTRPFCGGAGYDLTALQGVDITAIYGNYEWNLHPCGVLSPWYTNQCLGMDAMLCQSELDHSTQYPLAKWDNTIANTTTWIAIDRGVSLYVPDSGASCGGVVRDTTINFRCNRTARAPWLQSVTETSMCFYVAEVHTEYACDLVGSTAGSDVGDSQWSDICGAGLVDLSPIRSQAGDLNWDSNVPVANDGHRYYLELCGTVNEPSCASVQPTMFCQVDKNSTAAWSLSNHRAGAVQKYTVTKDGIRISLSDGSNCGSLGNRTTDIDVICDGTYPAVITSLREIETCHYVVIVHGQCNQGVTPVYDSSSSSSLSGGAIAGIVIGSLVGAAILLAILFVFCCGASSRSKKGSNRFDEQEESRNTGSEMEMEGSTA